MENTAPFCVANPQDKVMKNFVSKDIYRLAISFLKSKVSLGTDRPHPSKFVCNITCYNRVESIILGYENVLAPLTDVIRHIRSVYHSKTKYVFSNTNNNLGPIFFRFRKTVVNFIYSSVSITKFDQEYGKEKRCN